MTPESPSTATSSPPLDDLFLGDSTSYDRALDAARAAVQAHLAAATPYAGESYDDLTAAFDDVEFVPEEGVGLATAVERARPVMEHAVGVSHPTCIAHLQCPPMVPALAAEVMLTATNQSLDSWDQSPAATVLEEQFVGALCALFGFDRGDGVFTGGATGSTLLGLLLARERALADRGHDGGRDGVPADHGLRVLCSADAHFTTKQAAAVLGLGEASVVPVPTDDDHRMSVPALDRTLADLRARDLRPFALVGTAGTTDFGRIDPLDALADRAAENDLWLHVDAAYGGALVLSDRHREKLAGIDRADSVAVDFHKLFFQPISCGAFLLCDPAHFEHIAHNAAYLNPEDADVPNLVEKSLQTTRRFDALKPFLSLQAVGRQGFAALVDRVLDLADRAAARIAARPDFELACEPSLSTVVFRYVPDSGDRDTSPDAVNAHIRDRLLEEDEAVLARTEVGDDTYLKMTLLNPRTTVEHIERVLDAVSDHGSALVAEGVAT